MCGKRFVWLLGLLFLWCFSVNAEEWINNQLAVKFQDFVKENEVQQFTQDFLTYEVQEVYFSSNLLEYRIFSFNDKIIDAETLLLLVVKHNLVLSAKLRYFMRVIETPNDTLFSSQWNLHNEGIDGDTDRHHIDIVRAWDLMAINENTNTATIEVAVIDTGVKIDHEDLVSNISTYRWNFTMGTNVINAQIHGTAVAGVFGAITNNLLGISGISYENRIKIMPLQCSTDPELNPDGINPDFPPLAMDIILEQRTRYNETDSTNGHFVVAVNNSYGADWLRLNSDDIDRINALGEAGVLSVAGAGQGTVYNGYTSTDNDTRPFYPASYSIISPYMISVTGTDNRDIKVSHHNYGKKSVTLGAPTIVYTTSARPENNPPYGIGSGTSIASPHVAGVIGLMYEAASEELISYSLSSPSKVALLMKDYLLRGVDPVPSLANITVTGGRLNAYRAVFQVVSTQLITTNTTISNMSLALDKIYLVENGATLYITNATITADSTDVSSLLGFNVKNGNVVITDSDLDLKNASIRVDGDSQVTLNGGTLSMRYGQIEVSGGASFATNFTNTTLVNTQIDLDGSDSVVFSGGNISFSNATTIIGYSPAERVDFENATVIFSKDTVIKSGDATQSWDGLYFTGCSSTTDLQAPPSILRGYISGIDTFRLINSKALLNKMKISEIGQLSISVSQVDVDSLTYENNTSGILVQNSVFNISNSKIKSNGSTGLDLQASRTINRLSNVVIHENAGTGLNVSNSIVSLRDTKITKNAQWGFTSLSQLQSHIGSSSTISNNGEAEVVAMGRWFPSFSYEQFPLLPVVSDEEYDITSAHPSDRYYLMAFGDIPANGIDCVGLGVIYNQSRFYPSMSAFYFEESQNNTSPSFDSFDEGKDYIINENYEQAYAKMKATIEQYPDSDEAIKAISYLPHLAMMTNVDFMVLEQYLSEKYDDTTDTVKRSTIKVAMSQISLIKNDFGMAITKYQEIINDPPDTETQLLAELSQAYAHYMYYMTQIMYSQHRGVSAAQDVSFAKRQPRSLVEYQEIERDIYAQMIGFDIPNPPSQTLEKNLITSSNFPNPFNPETTISFTIPHQANVEISVYNIKGQKVKTLVNEKRETGTHHVVWNGKDNADHSVGSGIYFYRLVCDDVVSVKKMLLLK